MKRDFSLPTEDIQGLDSQGLEWDAINENNQWIIIRNWEVPSGYNVKQADVALRIPASYPDVQIDMVYFYPELSLLNGNKINAVGCRVTIENRSWQRWSRHRTSMNRWRPGVDCILTHLLQVKQWLQREISKEA